MTSAEGVPDRWFRVAVHGGNEDLAGMVAGTLVAAGGQAVVEEDGAWVTYLEPPDDVDGWVRSLQETLSAECGPGWAVTTGWQQHRDWEELWRVGLGPRRVGRSLVVAPSWALPEAGPGELVICIDPGMAFGTAEHATTRLALVLLEEAVSPEDRVLDVGSGSGVLSIAAVRLGAGSAVAIESDAYACAEAQDNLTRNRVANRVKILNRTFEGADEPGRFDGVISNMVRTRLLAALPGLLRARTDQGWMVLSGCEVHEAPSMIEVLRTHGLAAAMVKEEAGWWGGLFKAEMG